MHIQWYLLQRIDQTINNPFNLFSLSVITYCVLLKNHHLLAFFSPRIYHAEYF